MSDGSASRVVPFEAENFAARECYRPAYDRVAQTLAVVLDFSTAIDIGCGQGFLMDALLAQGIDVYGIEASPAAVGFASPQAAERTSIGNCLWANTSRRFDLVACVEVAEHIDPVHSQRLVEKLCDLAGRYIYFTAATPYQPGHGHINCRPTTDWLHFFQKNGWALDLERTIDIRARIGTNEAAPWIGMNTMLFVKE